GDALDPALALAARDEAAQPADDLAGPQRLLGRLVHGVAQGRRAIVRARLEQTARSLEIVGDCRERLVELVGERRGHLAERGQARDMHDLRLQLLKPRLGLLALGEVANEAGEEP